MPQNIYDNPTFFAGYQELRRTGMGWNEAIEQPALRSLLPDLTGKTVLDLGCGFGHFCRFAAEQGATSVAGVDISQRMLDQARDETSDTRVTYIQSSLETFEYDGPPVDVAVSSLTLHYVEDYPALLSRVYTWIADGGCFIFSVEHPMCTACYKGWLLDDNGRKEYWPVDNYNIEGRRDTQWYVDGVVKYHRTMASLLNGLVEAGFRFNRILEPEPLPEFIAERPDLEDERRRPPFLVVAAQK